MLTIKLFRTGKKNQPFFKIVVADKKNPPKAGRFVEQIGFYNPLTKEKNLKQDRAKYWLSVGAKPSDTIYNLLVSEGIIEGKKIDVHKKSKKKEGAAESVVGEEKKPAEEKPAEKKPKEEKPVEEKPIEKKPAEEKSVEEKPKEEKPVEKKPTEEKSVKKKPKEKKAKEEKAKEKKPLETSEEKLPSVEPLENKEKT